MAWDKAVKNIIIKFLTLLRAYWVPGPFLNIMFSPPTFTKLCKEELLI